MIKYRGVFSNIQGVGTILKGTKKELAKLQKAINMKGQKCNTFNTEREAQIFINFQGNITAKAVKEIYQKELKENQKKDKEEYQEIEDIKGFLKNKNNFKIKIFLDNSAIYCDAGERIGNSKEKVINITNSLGLSVLKYLSSNNSEFQYFLEFLKEKNWVLSETGIFLDERDIHFAEGVALYFAMEIAIKQNINIVYSDCETIVKRWINGTGTVKGIDDLELMYALYHKRKEFEEKGGIIKHIYGEINPADLGKHKKPNNVTFVSANKKHITVDEYSIFKKINDKIDCSENLENSENQLTDDEKNKFMEIIKKI